MCHRVISALQGSTFVTERFETVDKILCWTPKEVLFSISVFFFGLFPFLNFVDKWVKLPVIDWMVRRDSPVGIATRYELDGPGIEFRWGRDFPHPSIPALEPTHLPVKWVPGLFSGGYSGQGMAISTQSCADVQDIVELYLYSPAGPPWPVRVWTLHFVVLMIGVYLSVFFLAPCPCLGLTRSAGLLLRSITDIKNARSFILHSLSVPSRLGQAGRLYCLYFYFTPNGSKHAGRIWHTTRSWRCSSFIHQEITRIVIYAILERCSCSVTTYTSCQTPFFLLSSTDRDSCLVLHPLRWE